MTSNDATFPLTFPLSTTEKGRSKPNTDRDLHVMPTSADRKDQTMRLAMKLDVHSLETPTMTKAQNKWPDWVAAEPILNVVDDLAELPDWTRQGHPQRDDVVRALVKLGSPTGGSDTTATSAVCWLLLPAATKIYASMSSCGDDVSDNVASQLWIAVRDFDWRRDVRVALGIVRTTREAVQAEYGIGRGANRSDRAWASAWMPGDDLETWALVATTGHPRGACEEIIDLLCEAADDEVISNDEGRLLLELAWASDQVLRSRGPVSMEAIRRVAQRHNLGEFTIRRRTKKAVDQLAAHRENFLTPA